MHNEWPALGFNAPDNYYMLSEEDKGRIAQKSDDFCVIEHEEQTDRFIRAVLFQKVIDHCEELNYGVWVSLSEKSFNDYKGEFKKGNKDVTYFGFLCNNIPGYEYSDSIKTNVVVSQGDNRPEIIPHNDQMDNPFVYDYFNGITKEEAEKRIQNAIG